MRRRHGARAQRGLMKLKELSERLGLSQTTVSRALNGYPEVNEQTRERVMNAARQWGYRPNASARRLATGRVGAVGIVLPTAESNLIGPHTSEYLTGLAGRLAREEYDILITPIEHGDELAAFRRLIASRRVDALIIGSPTPDDPRVKLLAEMDFPFVLHGRTTGAPPHAWLDIDNRGGFRAATTALTDLGHRRIGLIEGAPGLTFTVDREAGYRDALAATGLPLDDALIVHDRFTDEIAFNAARQLLAGARPPTAFLAGSMMTALGVARAVRTAGMTLGREVSLIAHDDVFPYLSPETMVPSISTTRSSIRAAGARIAELVLRRLSGAPAEALHELWPVDLILRESTGPAPQG